jgi:hypothetical protein
MVYICKLFIGQLKEWLNKHTETLFFSFLLHPLVKAYYRYKWRIFFVHRHTSTYRAIQNFHKMMQLHKRKRGSNKKNALIRKCCLCLSSPSSLYNIIDYLSWKLNLYIYICIQVIDKRRRQRGRERKLLCLSLSLSPFAYTINERRTRVETDRFRYLYKK